MTESQAELERALQMLVSYLSAEPTVQAIGLSGGDRPLPEPGQGDIDLFVYATEIPSPSRRLSALGSLDGLVDQIELNRLVGGPWGQADYFKLLGVDAWIMTFPLDDTWAELESILSGCSPERLEDGYYPIGRCATWKNMRILYDPDSFLEEIQHRLAVYPEGLARKLIERNLETCLDFEDLERAALRSDLLFYHYALDMAIDHFLQALFALNREYFPGRKRTDAYLQGFRRKPLDCARRLRMVVGFGGNADTLVESFRQWQALVYDLTLLA